MAGYKHSPETRARISETSRAHWKNPSYREKLRRNCTGWKQSPEAIAKIAKAQRNRSPEHRRKLGEAAKKRWANPKYKRHQQEIRRGKPHSPEHRERIRQARLRQHFPVKMTNIEKTLLEQFKKRRLKFEMHKTMFRRFQPDFVFEDARLIVQADGDYWHRQSDKTRKRDARFNEVADASDWTVWRFAETEIKMHPEACGRAVARFIRSH